MNKSNVSSRCTRFSLAFAIVAVFMGAFVANDSASAAVVVSNASLSSTGTATLFYDDSRVAQKFTTGASASILNAVTLTVRNEHGEFFDAEFRARLHDTGSTNPGAVLETFADEPVVVAGTASTQITFDSIGSVLDANKMYWITLQVVNGPFDGDFELQNVGWLGTTDNAETSAFGWTIADNSRRRIYAQNSDYTNNSLTGLLQIEATLIPTPAALTAGLLGLTCLAGRRRRRH